MPVKSQRQKKSLVEFSWRHHFAAEGALLAAAAIMLMAAPVFVIAMTDATAVTTGSGVSLNTLQNQLNILNARLDSLSLKIDGLSGQATDQALSNPSVSECAMACARQKTSCATVVGGRASQGSYGCAASKISSCLQDCRSSAITCETSCAVQLGACVRQAGNNKTTAQACRATDATCLSSCGVGAVTAKTTVDSSTCQSQCRRENAICRQANRNSDVGIKDCNQTQTVCLEVACTASGSTSSGGTGTTNQAPGQQITVKCENACTTDFNLCRSAASGNIDKQATCNSSYGSCREACLKSIGGGMTGEGY